MSPIFNKRDVAMHESGHAVCNHFFGRATENIVLTFRPALNEWHGKTHAVPPKVPARIRTTSVSVLHFDSCKSDHRSQCDWDADAELVT